jgi:5-methylcytosine-specific restriction protein A
MPTRPLHPCAEPGCPVLVDVGPRCPQHRQASHRRAQAIRGTAARRGYDARHRRWRLLVLAHGPLCVPCLAQGRVESATVADHVIPLAEWSQDPVGARRRLAKVLTDRGRAWDCLDAWSLDNGQGLCVWCHNAKTAREKTARELAVTRTAAKR